MAVRAGDFFARICRALVAFTLAFVALSFSAVVDGLDGGGGGFVGSWFVSAFRSCNPDIRDRFVHCPESVDVKCVSCGREEGVPGAVRCVGMVWGCIMACRLSLV